MSTTKVLANPVQGAIDSSYRCSKAASDTLRTVVRQGGFQSDNIVSRLAIGRSLLDPLPRTIPEPSDSDGKEIRGVTLLGKPGAAALLVAMVTQHAGKSLSVEQVRKYVRFHWERGLKLLVSDLEKEQNSLDAVLSNYATRSVLTDEDFEEDDTIVSEDFLDVRIVGQEEAKKSVKRLLGDATKTDPAVLPETILFTGPASTGKTLFSSSIAAALRLPYVEVTGTMLDSVENLFDQIDAELTACGQKFTAQGRRSGLPFRKYPPLVIFIDEAHALKRPVQDALLTMTEPSERTAKSKNFIADMTSATILLATTDSAKLTKPLKTRTREIRLQPYTRDEVAEIVGRIYKGWPIEVRRLVAMAGRITPRMAKERGRDLARILDQDHGGSRPSEAMVIEVMEKEWGLDRLGLSHQDHAYLKLVLESKGPAGLANLASRMSLEPDQVEQEIEPFLLALGMMDRTAKGRMLTEQGKEIALAL